MTRNIYTATFNNLWYNVYTTITLGGCAYFGTYYATSCSDACAIVIARYDIPAYTVSAIACDEDDTQH